MNFRRQVPISILPALALGLLTLAAAARAEEGVRRQDQLWLVSTRQATMSHGDELDTEQLLIRRWSPASREWTESNWTAFEHARAKTLWSLIYVHGNRVEPGEDVYHGRAWYDVMRSADESMPPVQFVIWSWPSSQIRGQLRDVRLKYWRARTEARKLGWFLRKTPAQRPTLLLGFSYGGLIVPGALEVSAEHTSPRPDPLPWSAVLVAAAEPQSWLQPGGPHGRAIEAVRQLHIFVNACDPALKRFRAVDKCARPSALGYTGIDTDWFPNHLRSRVQSWDLTCHVGKIHDEAPYRCSGVVADVLREARSSIFARGDNRKANSTPRAVSDP